ncbi:aldehyde dehydrogenase family protein [Geomicrobium sp. JCM 19039]|uniref:aldehyde dehydrogenase family protein n=1 Tax=Geomicrobium sp. JCM 19039 TaxID=1460636 RepID=UPI00045F2D60|nr:aldehyde dehydrogenase family protein [Geomicrobium sp. JCM 19039]GAK12070.1 aldehyde dehydrogenase family protein [Geomicrobium sp. JCM 19039]
MRKSRPFIAGQWIDKEQDGINVVSPYSGEVIGQQWEADTKDVERALSQAFAGKKVVAGLSAAERARILKQSAELLTERKEEYAKLISLEVGKALKNTRDEVSRSIETLEQSAEEAKRLIGETIPGSASERGKHSMALTFRVPAGVIAAITPFNAPLNLVCHKVGPAFAAGNVTLLKPAPQTPLIAAAFVELMMDAGMPKEALHMVLGGREVGEQIVEDERTNIISFTGGVPAGRQISKISGMKKVLLELGGNSATIVHHDADINRAASLAVKTGFSNSGQSCISVQRVYVHEDVIERFVEQVKENVSELKQGDPLDESTDVGCVVDAKTGERIASWIEEAVSEGAELIAGGGVEGAAVQPSVLYRPKSTSRVVCHEVFGPLISILPYTDMDDAIDEVNDSEFGLQAGIFSNSMDVIRKAAIELEMGGVVVNGTSNYRLDHWPYGGIKNSGLGREGARFAVEEMSEMKMIVLQDFM